MQNLKRSESKRKVLNRKLAAFVLAMALLLCLCPQTLYASGGSKAGFTWTETYNMAVTEDPAVANGLPTGLGEDVYTKWATHIGTSYIHEVTNPVFLNDYIYIVGALGGTSSQEHTIRKIDPATGKILKEKKMAGGNGYSYFLQTAGDKLVVQEGLKVEAFDADLNSLWVTESMGSGTQGLCPLNYADGVVYGGTVGVGNATGCFFAVQMTDGKILWKQEAELVSCGSNGTGRRGYTGYYWAGAAVIGDYLVYGSEGGRVYSTNRHTGAIVDRYDISPEEFNRSIRSSVAYDGSCVYFTETTGTLYQVRYDAANGKFGAGKSQLVGETSGSSGFGGSCTATSVIYNNRLYVGDASCLAVFDTTDFSLIYRVSHSYSTLRDLRLVADTANNCVYVFTSYYKTPGSVVLMKDAPGQTSGELVDFSSLTAQWKQYSASMPVWGPDGTIYLTNDLGYLIAIGKGSAWLTTMSGNGTFDEELNNGTSEYEMVVSPGTAAAQLTLAVNEGSVLKVNGEEIPLVNQAGTVSIPLKEANTLEQSTRSAENGRQANTATANIEVVKDGKTRSYRVTIREASQNAEIADVVVNQSNSITGNVKEVKKLEDNVYICYGQNSTFMRLWVKAADEGAVKAVYALKPLGTSSRVDSETGLVGNTANGVSTYADYLRWNLYWTDEGTDMVLKVVVTAEDGISTTQRYYIITQEMEADFTGSQAETDILALIHGSAQTETLIQNLRAYYWQKNPAANYRQEQQTELLAKLNAGISAIQAAATAEEQQTALTAAKRALDEVKTDEALTREEQDKKPSSENENQGQDSTPGDQNKNQDTSGETGTIVGSGDTAGNWIIVYVVLAISSLGALTVLLQRKRQHYCE